MEELVNQDFKKVIKSVVMKTGKAKETGRIYYYLDIEFVNGYTKMVFVNNDMGFALKDSLRCSNRRKIDIDYDDEDPDYVDVD